MKLTDMTKSKYFKITLITLVGIMLLLGAFSCGIFVGFRKANFSYQWGENYQKNFGGPRFGFMGRESRDDRGLRNPGGRNFPGMGMMGSDFINAHGTAGTVLKIDGATLIIKGSDNIEKTVLTTAQTTIRKQSGDIKISDIKADDLVTVIGNPNTAGQIEAKFVRVFESAAPAAAVNATSTVK